jgi:DNA-binding response OmpR family regulator
LLYLKFLLKYHLEKKMDFDNDTPVRGDILIIDDEMPNLRVFSDILTAEGHEVRGAPDGPTALMIVENKPPEVILLDIRMPGIDGYEVCKRLKADENHRHIPVIFLSALKKTGEKVKGFEAGAVDFITKPFQTEEVLVRVNTHLTLGRLRKHLDQQMEKRTVLILGGNRNRQRTAGKSHSPDELTSSPPDDHCQLRCPPGITN